MTEPLSEEPGGVAVVRRQYDSGMSVPIRKPVTIDEALARDEDEYLELIDGELIEKASPTIEHSRAQGGTVVCLKPSFDRAAGGRLPGGWWFHIELDIQLGADLFRPDLCGYRRDRVAAFPPGRPVRLTPDWICEILSPSHMAHDRVKKLQRYLAAGVQHYWLIDPLAGTLEVLRRTESGYLLALGAQRGQRVRAEPFDAIEVRVDELLGADPEDAPAPP